MVQWLQVKDCSGATCGMHDLCLFQVIFHCEMFGMDARIGIGLQMSQVIPALLLK